jgi:hypothetical protein
MSFSDAAAYLGHTFSLIDAYQTRLYHEAEMARMDKHHAEEVDLSKDQHLQNILMTKQIHLTSVMMELEQHVHQLTADLLGNGKESERDMFDQRNQKHQTIILASSVMFGALCTTILQGILPKDSTSFQYVVYSITASSAFVWLLMAMMLCTEITYRASTYMLHKSKRSAIHFQNSLDKTKAVLRDLRLHNIGREYLLGQSHGDLDQVSSEMRNLHLHIFVCMLAPTRIDTALNCTPLFYDASYV